MSLGAQRTILFRENFEDETAGAVAPATIPFAPEGSGADWDNSFANQNPSTLTLSTATVSENTSKKLYWAFPGANTDLGVLGANFNPSSSRFVVAEYDVDFGGTPITKPAGEIFYTDGYATPSASSSTLLAIHLSFGYDISQAQDVTNQSYTYRALGQDKNIFSPGPSSPTSQYRIFTSLSWSTGRWYRVQVIADQLNHTYDAKIIDLTNGTTYTQSGAAYNDTTTGYIRKLWFGGTSSAATTNLDNVVVYEDSTTPNVAAPTIEITDSGSIGPVASNATALPIRFYSATALTAAQYSIDDGTTWSSFTTNGSAAVSLGGTSYTTSVYISNADFAALAQGKNTLLLRASNATATYQSPWTYSITKDTVGPVIAISAPASSVITPSLWTSAGIAGTVKDATTGVGSNATTFTLQRDNDNYYWTGTAWQAATASLATTHGSAAAGVSSSWSKNATLPAVGAGAAQIPEGQTMTLTINATDTLSNASSASTDFSIMSGVPAVTIGGSSAGPFKDWASFSASGLNVSFSDDVDIASVSYRIGSSGSWKALVGADGVTPIDVSGTGDTSVSSPVRITQSDFDALADGGQSIYFRVQDATHTVVSSDCVTLKKDATPPAIVLSTPAAGTYFSDLSNMNGTIAEDSGGSGVAANSLTFTIRISGGNYWNGTSFGSASAVNLATTHGAVAGGASAVSWVKNVAIPSIGDFVNGTSYIFTATASDAAGNSTTLTRTLTYGNYPEVAEVTSPAAGSYQNAATIAIAGHAADHSGGTGLGLNSTAVSIQRSSDSQYWISGTTWGAQTWLPTTHTATSGSQVANWTFSFTDAADGVSYTITPRAYNGSQYLVGSPVTVTCDTSPATISSTHLSSGNTYIDVPFSEGVWRDAAHSLPLTASQLSLSFAQNAGGATGASISSLTNTSGGALAGGESTIRAMLSVAPSSSSATGVETVALTPASGSSIYDRAGNPSLVTATTGPTNLNNLTLPRIQSATVSLTNAYVDVTFSAGVYETKPTPVAGGDFTLNLVQNGSAAGPVTIASATTTAGSALSGGETTVRLNLTVIGTPTGVETVEIKPVNGSTIHDGSGNAMDAAQTTGKLSLVDARGPAINSGSLASDNSYVDVTFSEAVWGNSAKTTAVKASSFTLDFAANGGTATGASIIGATLTGGGALSGGETVVRLNLSISGSPSGLETIAVRPASSASIYNTAAFAALSSRTTGAITLNATASMTTNWSGAASTAWGNSLNWDNGVPTAASAAVIPNTANKPVLSASATMAFLTIQSGASLDLAGFSLTVTGSFANSGTLRLKGIEATVSLPAGAIGGTVLYYGNGGGAITGLKAGSSYTNLSLATATGTTTWSLGAGLAVSGTLSVSSSDVLDLAGFGLSAPGTFSNSGTLRLKGAESINSGSGLSAAGNTEYYGTSDYATTPGSLAAGSNYGSLSFTGSGGTWKLGAALSAASLSVSSGASLDLSTFSVSGTTAVNNSGTLLMGGISPTQAIAGTITNAAGSTVNYYGSGTGLPAGNSYSAVTFSGSAAYTLGANLSASGLLTVGGTAALSTGGHGINAGDIALTSTALYAIDASASALAIAAAANTNIGLGAAAGAFSLTDAELALVRAASLSVAASGSGTITVSGLTDTNTAAIGLLSLSGAAAVSMTGASTFHSGLSASTTAATANALSVGAALTATTGGIALSGGSGGVAISAGSISAAGAVTVTVAGSALSIGAICELSGASVAIPATSCGANALTLTGDEIDLTGAASSVTGSSTLVLRPLSLAQPITFGVASDSGPACLDILASEIDTFKAGGFSSVTIGRSGGTGAIALSGSISGATSPLTFAQAATLANGQSLTTNGSSITLQKAVSLVDGASASLATNGGGATAGAIAFSSTIDGNSGAGNEVLSVTAGSGGASFSGVIGAVPLYDLAVSSGAAIALPAITVSHNLSISASGAVSQTGALSGANLAAKTLGGFAVNLPMATNHFSASVDLRARDSGDSAAAAGALAYVDSGSISVARAETLSTVSLTATIGAISQTGAISGTTLTTASTTGTSLGASNAVTAFTGADTGSGDISLTNAMPLTIPAGGLAVVSGKSIAIANTGAVVLTGNVDAGSGSVSIDSGGTAAISGAGTITANTLAFQTGFGSGLVGTGTAARIGTKTSGAGPTSLSLGNGTTGLTGAYISHNGALSLTSVNLATNAPLYLTASGNLLLPATSISTGSGALSLVSGTSLATAAPLSSSSSVSLTSNGGTLTVSHNLTGGSVSLTSSAAVVGTSAISGSSLAIGAVTGVAMSGASAVQSVSIANTTSGAISYAGSSVGSGNSLSITAANSGAGTGAIAIAETTGSLATAAGGIVAANAGATVTLTSVEGMSIAHAVTGPAGVTATVTGPGATLSHSAGVIDGTDAPLILEADKMALAGTGAIGSATTDSLTLRPHAMTEAILLGSAVDTAPSTLELSQAELNTVKASLLVGDAGLSGSVSLAANLSLSGMGIIGIVNGSGGFDLAGFSLATPSDLAITTSGAVASGAGALTVGSSGANALTVSAGGSISLSAAGNLANAVRLDTTLGSVTFRNSRLMTIRSSATAAIDVRTSAGTLATSAPVASSGGSVYLQSAGAMTIAHNVSADTLASGLSSLSLVATGAGAAISQTAGSISTTDDPILLQADDLALGGTSISAGTSTIALKPYTATWPVNIGGSGSSALYLAGAELDILVASGGLTIGDSGNTGGVSVSASTATAFAGPLAIVTGATGASAIAVSADLSAPGAIALTAASGGVSGTGAISSTASQSLTVSANKGIALSGTSPVQGVALANSGGGVSGNVSYSGSVGGGNTLSASASNAATSGGVSLTAATGILSIAAGGVSSSNGAVSLTADDMTIGNGVSSGLGRITILPVTAARPMNLGTNAVASTLCLDSGEIANLSSTGVIQLGGPGAGAMTVSAAVGNSARTYVVQSGATAGANITSSGPFAASALAIVAGGSNTIGTAGTPFAAAVSSLALSTSGGLANVSNAMSSGLTVTTVDTINGASTSNGALTLTETAGDVTIANTAAATDVNAGTGALAITLGAGGKTLTISPSAAIASNSASGLTLAADRMAIGAGAAIGGGSNAVTLRPSTAAWPVDLGSAVDTNAALELSDAELKRITTTGYLRVGSSSAPATGDISVSAAVAPTAAPNLHLVSGGKITESAAGHTIGATNLALSSAGIVNVSSAVQAAAAASGGSAITISNNRGAGQSLAVGSLDGVTGIDSGNATLRLTETTGGVSIANAMSSGSADLILTSAQAVSQGADITASGLKLAGAGSFTLTRTTNAIATLASRASGSISVSDADGYAVDTVDTTAGIDSTAANGGAVTLSANAGSISIAQSISTDGGAVLLSRPVLLTAACAVDTDKASGSTAAGNVTFSSTVDGARDLTVDATADGGGSSANVDFQAAVGATPLSSLTAKAATVRFGSGVATTGAQTVTATTIQTNGTHATANAAIDFGQSSSLVLQANTRLQSGSGAITLGAVTDGASSFTLALGDAGNTQTGAVTAYGAMTVSALTTSASAFDILLNQGSLGQSSTIDNAVSFANNGGALSIGNDTADSFTFSAGVSKIGAGAKTLAGTIAASNAAINFGTAGNVVLSKATVLNPGSGQVDLYSMSAAANVDLDIRGSGAVNLGSSGQDFLLGSGNLVLSLKTAGDIIVDGATVSMGGITMPATAQAFTLALRGNSTTVTAAANLSNMAALSLGDADSDSFTFSNGLTKSSSNIYLRGTLDSSSHAISLSTAGTLRLDGATTIKTGSSTLGMSSVTVNGTAQNLVLYGTGVATIAAANLGTGSLNLANRGAGGNVGLSSSLTAGSLPVPAADTAFDLSLNGGSVAANVDLTHQTGSLAIGSNGFTFSGGATKTVGGITLSGGSVLTGGANAIGFATSGTLTVSASTILGGAASATGAITLSTVSIASGATLTLGSGEADAFTVNGTVSGPGSLSVNTAASADLKSSLGSSGTPLALLSVTASNGSAFESTVDATSVSLAGTASGQTLRFDDALTVSTGLTTGTGSFSIALNQKSGGQTSRIGGATTIQTVAPGIITLGNDPSDIVVFAGGLAATSTATRHLIGTIRTNGAAMSLGAATLDGNTTLDSAGGPSTGASITLGAVSGAGHLLVADTGSAGSLIQSGATTITADSLRIVTGGAIGAAGTPLSTAVSFFEGQAGGLVNVSNSGALTLGFSGGDFDVTGTSSGSSGAITVVAGGNIGVAETVAANGTGVVTITGNLAGASLATSAIVSSGSGAVSLTADKVALGANVSSAGGALTIQPLTAGTTVSIGAAGGTFALDDAELLLLTNGFGSITLGRSTSGAVTIDTAAFRDPVTILGGGTITIASGTPSLSTSQDNAGITLTSIGADIVANGGIRADGSGAIDINSGAAFTQADGTSIASSGGAITIDTTGSNAMTINGSVSTTGAGTIGLTASDSIAMDTSSSISTASGSIAISSGSGGITADVIESTGGAGISITATGSSLTAADASMRLGAAGSSSLLVLSAGTTVGSALLPISTDVGILRLASGGDAYISEASAIQLGNLTSGVASTGGLVNIKAGGAIATANTVSSGGNGTVDIVATSGSVTISNAVSAAGTGNLSLNAAALLTVNALVSSGSGSLSLTGGTGVTHSAAGDLSTTGAGAIGVTATSGDLTMADGTTYGAGSGNVTLLATTGDIALGQITTTGDATITATAGAIDDITAAETPNASCATLTLASATGIGTSAAGGDVNTAAATLQASISGSGSGYVAEADGVALGGASGITTNDGSFTIVAGGAVTTGNAIAIAGAAGDLSISGTSLNITKTVSAARALTLTGATTVGTGADVQGGTGLLTFASAVTHSGGNINVSSGGMRCVASYTASGSASLNGSLSGDPNLEFRGTTVQFASFTHNDDTILFAQALSQTFDTNGNALAAVTVSKSGGSVTLASHNASQDPGHALTFSSTAATSLSLAGYTWTLGADLEINDGHSTLSVVNGHLEALAHAITIRAGTLNANGTSSVTTTGTFSLPDNSPSVTLGTGTFTVGAMSVASGSFAQSGNSGANTQSTTSLSVSGGSCSWDSGILAVTSAITATGGSLSLGDKTISAVSIDVTAGTIALGTSKLSLSSGPNTIRSSGTISYAAGNAINLNGASSLYLDSTGIQSVGAVNVNADTVLLGSGAVTDLTVASGKKLSFDASAAALTLTMGTAALAGSVTATGTLVVSDASNTVLIKAAAAAHPFTYAGSDFVYNGKSLTVSNMSAPGLSTALSSGEGLVLSGTDSLASATLNGDALTSLSLASSAQVSLSGDLTVTTGQVGFGASSSLSCAGLTTETGTSITNGASAVVTASGNVRISGGFGAPANSTLVMTGATRTLEATPQLGSLTVQGTISLASAIDLAGDLAIGAGHVLTVADASHTISLHGDWTNSAGTAGFVASGGTVNFKKASGTVQISGSTVWYVFACDVPGLQILFGNHPDVQTVTGKFHVYSTGTSITLSRITTVAPDPTYIFPSDKVTGDWPKFWDIDIQPGATLEMENVDVYYSNAYLHPVIASASVNVSAGTPYWDYKWLSGLTLVYSYTEDSNGDGKIDRIRVQAAASIGNDFSGFTASVAGYTVTGYSRPVSGANFYILLKEQPYNDTGATPSWNVTANTSLKDEATNTKLAKLYTAPLAMTPVDTAFPRITYTLALPGVNQVFVHASEPLYDDGGSLTYSIPGYTVDSATNVTTASGGVSEALLTLDGALPASLILAGATDVTVANAMDAGEAPSVDLFTLNPSLPHPTYPTAWRSYLPGAYDVGPANLGSGLVPPYALNPVHPVASPADAHRISDALVNAPPVSSSITGYPGYFVWPIYAKDQVQLSLSDSQIAGLSADETWKMGPGLIRAFDDSQWLRNQTLKIQSTLQDSATLGVTPSGLSIVYDASPASTFLSSYGLWLPTHDEAGFSGLAAYPNDAAHSGGTVTIACSNVSGTALWNTSILASDSKNSRIASGKRVDFFYVLGGSPASGQPLYGLRLDMTAGASLPADWYRKLKPFSFEVRDLTLQRGYVTILNNVIDPTAGDTARLVYDLPTAGFVTITVFTLDGDVVKRLDTRELAAGEYSTSWDGKNLSGKAVARGIYFIRVVAPGVDEIRKVLVVKK